MKILISLLCILPALTAHTQSPIELVSKTYFRAHPFDMKFSSFVKSLQQDPWFTLDTFNRRTDSTFFFITGTYKNFNPFRYPSKEIRLVVAEEEIIHEDSLKTHDTIINLQIMGMTDTGIVHSKNVEKEFRRFHNNQAKHFYTNVHEDLKTVGAINNYFIPPYTIAPVTVAWGRLPEGQYTFILTIRFKVKENMATYILVPGEF